MDNAKRMANDGLSVTDATLADEAGRAAVKADMLHAAISVIENRLFGPSQTGVVSAVTDASDNKPSLRDLVVAVRQRLESADDRLSSIIARL